jgi:hypothetical protein
MDFQQGAIDILDSERRSLLSKSVAGLSGDQARKARRPNGS